MNPPHPRGRRRLPLLVVTGLASVVIGCAGYQLGPVKPAAYQAVQSIAVPTFQNDTLEPRISVMVTNQVVDEFQADGTYRITERDGADAVLEGRILSIDRRQARSTRGDTLRARELEYDVEVAFVFREVASGKVLDEGTVTGSSSQFLGDNVQLSERQAIPLAARRLAETLVSRLAEGW